MPILSALVVLPWHACVPTYQARAFKLWLWYAGSQRRQRLALSRALARRQHMLLQGALSCWGQYVEQRKVKRQLGQQQGLQVRARLLVGREVVNHAQKHTA